MYGDTHVDPTPLFDPDHDGHPPADALDLYFPAPISLSLVGDAYATHGMEHAAREGFVDCAISNRTLAELITHERAGRLVPLSSSAVPRKSGPTVARESRDITRAALGIPALRVIR